MKYPTKTKTIRAYDDQIASMDIKFGKQDFRGDLSGLIRGLIGAYAD